jgi:class 3 adenylate cyclase
MPEERKLVTILFADVTNSTSLGESLDPEDMRALMGRYYEHARAVVASYGGVLEKFIGDAVMAVFGLPTAHGDDAERALAAALVLREVTQQDVLLGESFQLRMGVNSGEVMATSDTLRSDFLVTGDAVNVAARLEQHANPGEIIASERTAQAARMAFLFEEPREIQVKGKQLPLRIFSLKEKRTKREVERPPLVGRKQDILQLEILRERIIEEERPQLVSIIAPAGTGKTRLLEEFLSRLDPKEGFQIATARCLPYGQTLTYWPLQGLLSELLGAEVTKEQVAASFIRGGYKTEDTVRLTGYILSTLGMEGEGTGSTDRELIFNAWRLLIESLAREAPRIILFEDLQWASDSLLDLVEHVTYIRTQASLLLIALSRPELLDRRPNWGGGRQNFTSLALQPLSVKQTAELIKQLTSELPEEVSRRIIENSGGNPFFALELLRGLAERGLAGSSATVDALPDTVHAAVLARLDLLSKIERDVLQVASVASRVFSFALLHGTLPEYSEDEIRSALSGLLARDMIISAPGDNFTFRHILILDVTYGTLARAERIRLHKAIATLLLEKAGEHIDEQVELLAYHYHKVVQLARMSAVPQKLEIETERAIKFLARAGELASRSGAFSEVQGYFQNAIALAAEKHRAALYEQLGDSLSAGWGWAEQEKEAYMKALELWRKQEGAQPLDGARLIRKLLIRDKRFSLQRKFPEEEVRALWQEGTRLVEQTGDLDEEWRLRTIPLFLYGDMPTDEINCLLQTNEIQHLQQLAAEATQYFTTRQDWEFLSEMLDGYTGLQMRLGWNAEALATIELRLQFPNLSMRERCDAIGMFNIISLIRGKYAAAITMMSETLDKLRPGEPVEYFGNTLGSTLWALYLTGRWSEVPRFQQALDDAWKRVQEIQGAWAMMVSGYQALLCIELARENRAGIDTYEAMLRRLAPATFKEEASILTVAYRDEDLDQVSARRVSMAKNDDTSKDIRGLYLMPFSEHGRKVPEEMKRVENFFSDDLTIYAEKIAQALDHDDNEELAQAIDEAEAHQLIVHAARMRIILAKRTGDHRQLELARPVLERLEDHLFLRKLHEVEAMFQIK